MLNPRLENLNDYPFHRLTALLGPTRPDALVMSIGEPQHPAPAWAARLLAENEAGWSKYPPGNGTPDYRAACAEWLTRRFTLPQGFVDPERHLVPVAGTREALYLFAQVVGGAGPALVGMPNPFYQAYYGAAVMAGHEPVFVPATRENGFLPDFAGLDASVLSRLKLVYLCSPANPHGAVADRTYLERLLALARKHDFFLVVDECYCEIYLDKPPPSALEAAASLGGGLANLAVFHSLSKRSSVPGMRIGFACGDEAAMAAFIRLRSYGGASVPLPVLTAGAALWRDEAHVAENRTYYRAKFELAERRLGNRLGFYRPDGGFFLWLDVGDGEQAALKLWREAGIRVLPGGYLAKAGPDGQNPGAPYIRVALVHDMATTERALGLLSATL
jgi:N-succinyldiaminopimelate aminotransferase